jgi:hypothetical protein
VSTHHARSADIDDFVITLKRLILKQLIDQKG